MITARRWVWNDVVFTAVALLLVASTYTPLAGPLNELLCAASHRGASWLLSAIAISHSADDAHRLLAQGPFALEVSGLCSGLRAIAVLAAVLILVPIPRRWKLIHFALGAAALMLVNVLRLAHLFHLGARGSPRFALFHEWLWPAAMVGIVLLYRLLLLLGQRGRSVEVRHG